MFTSPPFAAVHSLKLSRTDLVCTQNEHILEAVLYGFRINQRLCGLLLIHESDSRNKNGCCVFDFKNCQNFMPGFQAREHLSFSQSLGFCESLH